ncbi:putative FHA domain protein SNIP1 [Taphrina deformans PYCC 5710]|uniref:FHA domain protein SNIP1 n=1 Tax=Taphrina deformans (strain PYCC 5710 / ATCC 11124 / CBS 356.35 / IMI 108563 / JCM 9778 / NBRC 8474) TaxID=1097556 RepID=R4X7D3_TAPDE|nr:putative FHA domain protein SNIP1 [Taphrina deformans PYCC 5710]|eukprot:CCG81270.1 putative FHA domain protein SNIP1 [Taphrina deformans PYCC 5710]
MPRDRASHSPARTPYDRSGQSQSQEPCKITEKQKPNFKLSGALAAESKTTTNGTVLKYHEPSEAAKPKQKWRLYVYKGSKEVDMYRLGGQSAYLFGRDRLVVDVPTDHESCSKQHAVIQFRESRKKNEYGDVKVQIKPYLIDLESTNKSYVNDKEIPESRYYELRHGDTLTFGDSDRDYVLILEES